MSVHCLKHACPVRSRTLAWLVALDVLETPWKEPLQVTDPGGGGLAPHTRLRRDRSTPDGLGIRTTRLLAAYSLLRGNQIQLAPPKAQADVVIAQIRIVDNRAAKVAFSQNLMAAPRCLGARRQREAGVDSHGTGGGQLRPRSGIRCGERRRTGSIRTSRRLGSSASDGTSPRACPR